MATPRGSAVVISDLFPEILELVFTYLEVRDKGRVAQVCRKWRDVAYSRSVWRNVEAKLHVRGSANKRKHSSSNKDSGFLLVNSHHLAVEGPSARTACTPGREGLCPTLFPSLVKRGINRVQVLSLRQNLRSLVEGIPHLVSLNLSGCFTVTDAGLKQAFAHDMPCLTTLNLSLCKQVTDHSLGHIAMNLKNLEELELGGTFVTNTGVMAIAVGLKKLKSLNLRGCNYVSDLGIAHIAGQDTAQMCGNFDLEYLGLQDCQKVTDDALQYVSVGLTSLKSINLSFCFGVTDAGIKSLARMTSLCELNMRRCNSITDSSLRFLSEGVAPLSAVDVSFCEKVGDQGLIHLSKLISLRSLSFNSCDISDDGIEHILNSLHDLTTLNIGQCSRISDRSLALISTNLKQLSSIDLYGCTRITTQGLEKIMKLPSLSTLNLGLWHKK